MNCKDARALWNHKGGLIGGLNCKGHGYDQVVPYLTELAWKFVKGSHDPFNEAVKKKAGAGPYFVTHSDGESELAKKVHDVVGDQAACHIVSQLIGKIVGRPNLQLANICCNGCKISDGSLENELTLRIQMAAVNTNPDGTDIA